MCNSYVHLLDYTTKNIYCIMIILICSIYININRNMEKARFGV